MLSDSYMKKRIKNIILALFLERRLSDPTGIGSEWYIGNNGVGVEFVLCVSEIKIITKYLEPSCP